MKKFNDNINKLTPIQFEVTQKNGTERPFTNEYHDQFAEGIYVDIVSKEVLFSSVDKFDAHCGWPSFSKPINENLITLKNDYSYSQVRKEVRSTDANSHLGHVFDDGPNNTQRYCINSASLEFIPISEMGNRGYTEYLKLFQK